ncbi:tetraacyldisaccharide 4'-kinase [Catenovulum sp. SX2]|uniref:tetraacyldisaccharide 4'-kinase n=1 Tax=Catenovulum sp. SX2 TaxID=3398614 RepID=UPI003F868EED
MNWIERGWYKQHKGTYLLLPLTLIFWLLSALRRCLFKLGIKKSYRCSKPVIVVGNITVGGTGKTPFVIWLVEYLQQQGLKPAVISRGYGGQIKQGAHLITVEDSAELVGDETRLIANRTSVPVVVGANRADCCNLLEQQADVDIIISDDGLQHYALQRDLEIILLDGNRLLGNGFLLPTGPLREGAWRLNSSTLVITNGRVSNPFTTDYFVVEPQGLKAVNPKYNNSVFSIDTAYHAVCAIGNPQRFYDSLAQESIQILEYHHFLDHHKFNSADFDQLKDQPVIMTEKDAVKCQNFAKDNWCYLPIGIQPNQNFVEELTAKLKQTRKNYGI